MAELGNVVMKEKCSHGFPRREPGEAHGRRMGNDREGRQKKTSLKMSSYHTLAKTDAGTHNHHLCPSHFPYLQVGALYKLDCHTF